MLGFNRPPEPAGFAAAVKDCREDVEKAALEYVARLRGAADDDARKALASLKPEFEDKWGGFKDDLSVAQHGKCAYCEIKVMAGSTGAVEHYHPKGEVWELSDKPGEWGRELGPGLSNVRGRKAERKALAGYWWLAYEWANYLLSCERCNTAWKKSYFPVREAPRELPPDRDKPETALLLNPFDTPIPYRHFRFDRLGQIEGTDVNSRGFETVRTCGLDRESLRDARDAVCADTHRYLDDYARNSGGPLADVRLRDIWKMGIAERAHAGAVRSIFERVTEMQWHELETIVSALGD